jgi:hypothetical protein
VYFVFSCLCVRVHAWVRWSLLPLCIQDPNASLMTGYHVTLTHPSIRIELEEGQRENPVVTLSRNERLLDLWPGCPDLHPHLFSLVAKKSVWPALVTWNSNFCLLLSVWLSVCCEEHILFCHRKRYSQSITSASGHRHTICLLFPIFSATKWQTLSSSLRRIFTDFVQLIIS